MITILSVLLGTASLVSALPLVEKRVVTALNQAAFAQAQPRDDTATRAFSSTEIKTSDGKCLFVDELSGDFRANLTPIQVAACDGSAGQLWDVITRGKHDNQAGTMLIVSTLTQACFNFDPRRAAGNQVLLFSCGGRGDGGGLVTNSQLFPFTGGAGPLALTPENAPGTCLTVKGTVIDQAACNAADANQSFSFGDSTASATPSAVAAPAAAPAAVTSATSAPAATTTVFACETSSAAVAEAATTAAETSSTSSAVGNLTAASVSSTSSIVSTTTAAAVGSTTLATTLATTTPASVATTSASTTVASGAAVAVSRAGTVLNPSAAAEANVRDDTATRAFSSVSLKSASGQCLFIDPTAGDFRENLIPIALKNCDGSANEKWDIITAGKHNNAANSALMVSTETQGCMNFDPRRAAGDTVLMFSCGGRADGEGLVTDSQLFAFSAGEKSLQLKPNNGAGSVCLVPNGAKLDQAACSEDASQLFTIA